MRITQLTIKDFRNIEYAELATKHGKTALFGLNGQGKSSVLYALQMLLMGHCEHTGRDGRGADALIRQGARCAYIGGTVEHAGRRIKLAMTLKQKGQTNEYEALDLDSGEVLDIRAGDIWGVLDIRRDHAWACMMPAQFIGSKESADILAEYAADAVTEEGLAAIAPAKEWNSLKFWCEHALTSLGLCEQAGARAYNERRDLKANLKALEIQAQDMPFVPQPKNKKGELLTLADLPRIQQTVKELRAKRDRLNIEVGNIQASGDADALKAKRGRLQANAADAAKALDAAADAANAARAALGDAEAARLAAQTASATATERSRQAESALRQAQSALALAQKLKTKCPTCGQRIGKDVLEAITAPLAKAAEDAQVALDAAKQESAKRLTELTAAHDAVATARDAAHGAESAQRYAVQHHEALRVELANMPEPATRTVAEVDAEIAEIDTRIASGDALAKQIEAWNDARLNKEQQDAVRAEIEFLNWVVMAFKDGELTNRLVVERLGELFGRANAVLDAISSRRERVHAQANGKRIDVLVETESGMIPVERASQGQQALVQYAVAMAFGSSGAPVVLDELNALDSENRRAVLKHMRTGGVDHVIVAAAWQQSGTDWAKVAAALAPIDVYFVEGGTAQLCGAQEAAAA